MSFGKVDKECLTEEEESEGTSRVETWGADFLGERTEQAKQF